VETDGIKWTRETYPSLDMHEDSITDEYQPEWLITGQEPKMMDIFKEYTYKQMVIRGNHSEWNIGTRIWRWWFWVQFINYASRSKKDSRRMTWHISRRCSSSRSIKAWIFAELNNSCFVVSFRKGPRRKKKEERRGKMGQLDVRSGPLLCPSRPHPTVARGSATPNPRVAPRACRLG
jgi:hypothetical protein